MQGERAPGRAGNRRLVGLSLVLVAWPLAALVGCSKKVSETSAPVTTARSARAVRSAASVPASASVSASASVPVSASAASMPSAPASLAASVAAAASSREVPGVPRALQPAWARGTCTDRSMLKTRAGEVNCYPYRCRADRCLLSCQTRDDCAGSRGPDELEKYGWPLECSPSQAICYPLSPSHVQQRR